MPTRFTSHVALPDETKVALVETLNVALATTIDLQSQLKQAHWNIKGPQFFARHELFDNVAVKLRDFADSIAERATTLGGYAQGTIRLSVEASKLPEYELRAVDGKQHIQCARGAFQRLHGIRTRSDQGGGGEDRPCYCRPLYGDPPRNRARYVVPGKSLERMNDLSAQWDAR